MKTLLLLLYLNLFFIQDGNCYMQAGNNDVIALLQQATTKRPVVHPAVNLPVLNALYSEQPSQSWDQLLAETGIDEDESNEYEAGLYLLPSVVDFHFVKYLSGSTLYTNKYFLLFQKPAACLYLLQQVFRI